MKFLFFGITLCLMATGIMSFAEAQIAVDQEHPQWLQYGDGRPFFLAGPSDPEDFLYRAGDQLEIIEQIAQHGGKTLYVQAIRSHGGDGDASQNPFIDSDPRKGLDQDILNQWEEWFLEAEKNGILVFFFFYDDNIQVSRDLRWPLDRNGNLAAGEREYIENIVNRFEHHENMVWVVMEEVEEMSRWQMPFYFGITVSWLLAHKVVTGGIVLAGAVLFLVGLARMRKETFIVLGLLIAYGAFFSWYYLIPSDEYIAHTKKIAEVIAQADDGHHLIAVHKAKQPDFSEFADDPNIDIYMMKKDHGESTNPDDYHQDALEAVRVAAGRYVVIYAELFPFRDAARNGDRDLVRKAHWAIAMGGVYPMMVGPWDSYVGSAFAPEMLEDLKSMQEFFESTTFNEMMPHDELAYGETQYVLADPRRQYIAYSSVASEGMGLQGMEAARYDFLWYDIGNNRIVLQKNVQVEEGAQTWVVPQGMGEEIVLYITRI